MKAGGSRSRAALGAALSALIALGAWAGATAEAWAAPPKPAHGATKAKTKKPKAHGAAKGRSKALRAAGAKNRAAGANNPGSAAGAGTTAKAAAVSEGAVRETV